MVSPRGSSDSIRALLQQWAEARAAREAATRLAPPPPAQSAHPHAAAHTAAAQAAARHDADTGSDTDDDTDGHDAEAGPASCSAA